MYEYILAKPIKNYLFYSLLGGVGVFLLMFAATYASDGNLEKSLLNWFFIPFILALGLMGYVIEEVYNRNWKNKYLSQSRYDLIRTLQMTLKMEGQLVTFHGIYNNYPLRLIIEEQTTAKKNGFSKPVFIDVIQMSYDGESENAPDPHQVDLEPGLLTLQNNMLEFLPKTFEPYNLEACCEYLAQTLAQNELRPGNKSAFDLSDAALGVANEREFEKKTKSFKFGPIDIKVWKN